MRHPILKRGGFTLVEVIIVVGITAILAGLILTYTSTSRDQVALFVEQAKLAQTISRAKALTLATYNRPIIPCGYGVHFDYDVQSYSLFSYNVDDCKGIRNLDFTNPQEGEECTATSPVCLVHTEKMPLNVLLQPSAEDAIQDILFIPPDPKTWIWQAGGTGDLATSTEGRVYLGTHSDANVTIGVSQAGQITF